MSALPIFIGGTGSSAGKSWVATAICRYLYRLGYRVAPFKAQNMSNNSAVCSNGGEIGRAQAAQAEACGLEPETDMNPILLKPAGSVISQVVVHGRVWMNLTTREYYSHIDSLFKDVLGSYERLAKNYEFIVIEGAGSVTELNLKPYDLVNLGLARRLNAPAILVADIDRGGVFSSIVGTFQLLEPEESRLVQTFLVNRFHGDMELFRDGVKILEEKTGRPCLGVFPYVQDLTLDPEDTLNIEDRAPGKQPQSAPRKAPVDGELRIAIVRLPHISNFTDFRLLPGATYLSQPTQERFDVIFIPGTKNTMDDMVWLRDNGLEGWLLKQAWSGTRIVGICGGYQLLGESISDPYSVESSAGFVRGLGLIPANTILMPQKTTRRVTARTPSGIRFHAYEIHMGVTSVHHPMEPFARIEDGGAEGVRMAGIAGTYLHGALESQEVLEELLGKRLSGPPAASKDVQYDRLADWFALHVNDRIFEERYLSARKRMTG